MLPAASIHISVLAAVLLSAASLQHNVRTAEPPSSGDRVLLLELFTSQGCSSCPPADRVLSTLARDPELRDRIVPLAFHVDYWNYIGWADPFSKRAYSGRQREYGRAFELRSVYTPQLVIQGERQMVGSKEREIRRAIHALLKDPSPVSMEIDVHDSPASTNVNIRWNDDRPVRDKADLVVVVYENALVTEVSRGENGGRELRNDAVVRSLDRIGSVDLKRDPQASKEVALQIGPDWNRDHLGVVAFLQNPRTLQIQAVSRYDLGAHSGSATNR